MGAGGHLRYGAPAVLSGTHGYEEQAPLGSEAPPDARASYIRAPLHAPLHAPPGGPHDGYPQLGDPRSRTQGKETGNPLKNWFPKVGASEVVGRSVPASALQQIPVSVPPPGGVQLSLSQSDIPNGVFLHGPIYPPNLQIPDELAAVDNPVTRPRETPHVAPLNTTAGPVPRDPRPVPPAKPETLKGPPASSVGAQSVGQHGTSGTVANAPTADVVRPGGPAAPAQIGKYLVTPLRTPGVTEAVNNRSVPAAIPASKVRPRPEGEVNDG